MNKPWKPTRNPDKPWKHLGQPIKPTKNRETNNIENIANDGQVRIIASVAIVPCVPKRSLLHHFQKNTIAIASPQQFDHRSSLYCVMVSSPLSDNSENISWILFTVAPLEPPTTFWQSSSWTSPSTASTTAPWNKSMEKRSTKYLW